MGQPIVLEPREDEAVDRRPHPGRIADGGRLRTARPAIRPVPRRVVARSSSRVDTLGPDRSLIDPRANELDLCAGQRLLASRHPGGAVEAEHTPDEKAVLAVAGNDGGAADAAGHRRRASLAA